MSDHRLGIILVEDDASLRRAIQRMLEAAGYRITPHASAEALLEAGIDRVKQSACLVFDIGLPGMSGLDLCRTLMAISPCPPCILITGIDTPELHSLAEGAGAHSCLLKPFSGTALLDAVKQAIPL
ncbi:MULTISPECIES: response regulator transcription factor [unclassified Marinobacter]|uniref:response regulator transcription factor n=1 Tax=unclassified Marinobacter TaxID=83889 RepID=UPI0019291A98|nr:MULTISPECIES: response regulator [unclassified Marinobacter]MBL3827137.1 response regulator [Marinobacter sp. MC3]